MNKCEHTRCELLDGCHRWGQGGDHARVDGVCVHEKCVAAPTRGCLARNGCNHRYGPTTQPGAIQRVTVVGLLASSTETKIGAPAS